MKTIGKTKKSNVEKRQEGIKQKEETINEQIPTSTTGREREKSKEIERSERKRQKNAISFRGERKGEEEKVKKGGNFVILSTLLQRKKRKS